MEQERQNKIQSVIKVLQELPHVEVKSDDWDSNAVNVFIYLNEAELNKTPHVFVINTKRGIKRILSREGIEFRFLDWPEMQYETFRFHGEREKRCTGYNQSHIKIEVYI